MESSAQGVRLFGRKRPRGAAKNEAPVRTKADEPPPKANKAADEADEADEAAQAAQARRRLGEGDVEDWSFEALGLSPWLVRTCETLGMSEPTLVQKRCVPPTLEGSNIIGSAPTGSGKTAAFALPILDKLAVDMFGVFAVVVTPTRELAFQIADQFQAFGAPIRVKCEVIVGGTSLIEQQLALSTRPHIVVATPGRLAAHLRGPSPPKIDKARFLVLDEADRLLEPAFAEDLGLLFKRTPESRQTLLYSATMTSALETAKKASKKRVVEFHATKQATTPDALDERYLLIPKQVKPVYLAYALRRLGPELSEGPLSEQSLARSRRQKEKKKVHRKRADAATGQGADGGDGDEADEDDAPFLFDRANLIIVFTSSCKTCQLIGGTLQELGLQCSVLHSGLNQGRRMAALGKFRSRVTQVLVATDVASRGLDIPQVDLVLNYDVPHSVEDYIHRVGRTARAGRKGLSLTFVTQYDIKLILAVEATTGVKLRLLPGVDEERDVLVLLTRVTNALKAARIALMDSDQTPKRRRKLLPAPERDD